MPLELSSLGLGTYLGDPDAATSARYGEAARAFFNGGGNVFDTAANYRMGLSERALGEVFRGLPREAFFVSTKAGYLPLGGDDPRESPRDWFNRVLAAPGILQPGEVVDGCHAMTPKYLRHQLGVSLEALAVGKVDLFHLHNPEQQRPTLGPERFRAVMRAAFEACEGFVRDGLIGSYGCATWNGFRVPAEAPEHLGLEELLGIAREVGGADHHFRWVQLPLNLAMPEALVFANQAWEGETLPFLEASLRAGLQVQTSASMMQARILRQIPPKLGGALGTTTPAQTALQFTRSCPGVTVALCGMSRVEHVTENLTVLNLAKAQPELLRQMVAE
jgi:aryl-alcohol dehydrogenase-like predicted oxidoreductase